MKKLISIGVALALLAMVMLPGAVAAQTPPPTYAKVPFAIIASGIELVGTILESIGPTLGLPDWIPSLMPDIAGWTYGPLSWTVDMLGWGIALTADVVAQVDPILEAVGMALPISMADVAGIIDTVACGLRTCFDDTCVGNFTCPP